MSKQSSVCKIYYFPSLDGGGFEEVPTAEYQQPEKSIEEQMMDFIGLLWLVPALMTVILAYHFNLWVIPAALSAARQGLGWYCRQRGWW